DNGDASRRPSLRPGRETPRRSDLLSGRAFEAELSRFTGKSRVRPQTALPFCNGEERELSVGGDDRVEGYFEVCASASTTPSVLRGFPNNQTMPMLRR